MPSSIADILADAKNVDYVRVAIAKVLIRQDLLADHADLETELAALTAGEVGLGTSDAAHEVAEKLAALEADIEVARVEFRFRQVGKKTWADLLVTHPPTREQRQARPALDHNPATFPVAAIAASCIDPAMTVDEVGELEQVLNQSQWDALWSKCLEANMGGAEAPKSVAAGLILRRNGASATTAVSGESHAPFSSAE